ncbi:MAG: hypothetical protein LC793_24020, partial [Thermomicrobia bacterium]|nr:hypothetical protein [Thermomicrobia bacterium]
MNITLPTLNELEAWWQAHPKSEAITCDETACLIAVPLRDLYPLRVFGVIPRAHGENTDGFVRVYE